MQTKSDFAIEITVRSAGVAVDITGWALEMDIRQNNALGALLLVLTTGAGLALTAPTQGKFSIFMSAAQTTVIGAGDRVFAIYRTDGGQRLAIITGRLSVQEGV